MIPCFRETAGQLEPESMIPGWDADWSRKGSFAGWFGWAGAERGTGERCAGKDGRRSRKPVDTGLAGMSDPVSQPGMAGI